MCQFCLWCAAFLHVLGRLCAHIASRQQPTREAGCAGKVQLPYELDAPVIPYDDER